MNNDILTVADEKIDSIPVTLKKVGIDNATGTTIEENLGGAQFTIYTDAAKTTVATGTRDGKEIPLSGLLSSQETGIFFNGRYTTKVNTPIARASLVTEIWSVGESFLNRSFPSR